MKELKEIELIKKVYVDKGRPNNEVQSFALSCLIEYKKQLLLHNVVKSFSAEQVVNELKDCETLDDAIMYFSEIK